jgi:transposase InsO family protein
MYVPDSDRSILSLMGLHEQGLSFAFVEDTPIGAFTITSRRHNFQLDGTAIDKILYATEYPDSQPLSTFAVTARNQSHKRKREDETQEETAEENFADQNEIARPTKCQKLPTPPPTPAMLPESSDAPRPLRCDPGNLWHLRFAHASQSTLAKHPGIESNFNTADCKACMRSKHRQRSHHTKESSANRICDLIHSDLCGPFPISKGGCQYFVTFLHDVSHYLFNYPTPDKTSARILKTFEDFIALAETQTERRIKRLQTDGGGEYLGDLTTMLEAYGIIHKRTPAYTPQANGAAERINRTITESIGAMLYHANLPESFWAEAASTAAFTWNRLPSSAIHNQIPFELWFHRDLRRDEIQCLRTFGCMAYVHTRKQQQIPPRHMAYRSTKGCFVGYVSENSTTLYKIWDLERRRFVTSDSVIFRELEFPAATYFQDEVPISESQAPYQHPTRTVQIPTTIPRFEPRRQSPLPEILDEIVVQPPPAVRVFSTDAQPNLNNEPTSFHEAIQRPDADKWIAAMIAEIDSIMENRTWTLCDLPPGKNCITVKWVFKIKLDGNNKIERYKCRIVVRGFSQIAGLDFEETFAPIVRIESVRCLFAHAAFEGLHLLHIDCKTAFLNGQSDVKLYVEQPEGFIDERYPHKVLWLNKLLYRLKQAPRIWYLLLCNIIISLSFTALESDPSIYRNHSTGAIIAVYVDDILVAAPTEHLTKQFYSNLAKHFRIENIGPPTTFLGLNISQTQHFSDSKFIDNQPNGIHRTDAHSIQYDKCHYSNNPP